MQINKDIYVLHGIDAPEQGQKCATINGKTWACGKEATEKLSELAAGKEVICEELQRDEHGRIIAICRVGELELNDHMVRIGLAWAFRKFSEDYVEAEAEAKASGVGIWQAATQTAEDFRAERWEEAENIAPTGCPIKGNISSSGRIYHAPWSPWYNRTKINESKGEKWFCSEGEAVNAGWRAPLWGR